MSGAFNFVPHCNEARHSALTRAVHGDLTWTEDRASALRGRKDKTPQSVSFAALQDGVRDGDQLVPVRMTTAGQGPRLVRQPPVTK